MPDMRRPPRDLHLQAIATIVLVVIFLVLAWYYNYR
jgi:hypothetical protein